VVVADATTLPLRPACFDRVLVDAPCSGLGALRRRPDARWRITETDIDELAALQARILRAARALVRPGGTLVYSVCTLTAAESVDQDTFGWEALPPPPAPWRPYGRGARLLPHHADTDGMVLLRWRAP
jgi:16S rRNA (cytosine967-C5)-methyltransferase